MDIVHRTVGNVTVLSIAGDITLNGTGATGIADRVRGELQQGRDRVVLDLGHVRYVDSAGLGELVHALSAVRTRGGALKLLNVTRGLDALLVVTGLRTIFECFDREAEALASFDRHPVAR